MSQANSDDQLRNQLRQLLEDGLETEVEPRAYDPETLQEIIGRLGNLAPDAYGEKLRIAGFTLHPWQEADGIEQACETCMYYGVHRRFCELPELMVPVEPEWSCRLWRI